MTVLDENTRMGFGLEQMRLGNPHGAIEQFRQVLAFDPEHAAAHACLALCLVDTRRPFAAEHEAGLALACDPENAFNHMVAGIVAVERQKYRLAEEHLERAHAIDHTQADVYRWLARVYGLTGREAMVMPTLREGLERDPQDVEILAALGHRHLELGAIDAAEHHAREALAINAESLAANVLQGHVLLRRGDIEGAKRQALMALRHDAGNVGGLYLLCGIKARTSPMMGLWWRYAAWMARFGDKYTLVVIIGSFALYRVAVQLTADAGYPALSGLLTIAWLLFCVYTWSGVRWFQRAVQKELATVRLKGDF